MALPAGQRLGSYEIVSALGAGGMGEVYRARDTRLGRDVAIKILPPALANDSDRLARFEREARLLASLNNPHIAAIYGVEDADGVQALVLELVEGETLAERLQNGPTSVGEAVGIGRQLLAALDAAHEKGIVHRDLKPANIKVTPDGVVKVLDFGLAKVSDDGVARALADSPTITSDGTRAGVLLGTAAYMSPEQARGRIVDKRTDIWAFGCVMYEMLAGRPAFLSDSLSETLASILERDPEWHVLRADTPPSLASLLKRLLEKDPKRRVRDIADVGFDLEQALRPTDVGASGSPAPRGRLRLLAVAFLGVGIGIGIGIVLGRTRLPSTPVAPVTLTGESIVSQLTNYDGTETSPAISPDGRAFVFASTRGGAADIWLRQTSGGEPVRLTNDAALESSLVFSPDGESIYYTRSEGTESSIWRIGALGGQPRKVIADGRAPAISKDGRSIAWFARDSDGSFSLIAAAIDGSGRRVLAKTIQAVVDVNRASWSPDGRFLAYCSGGLFAPRNLFLINVRDGQVRQVTRFERSTDGPSTQEWLPDGRHLVISYRASTGALGATDLGILDSTTGSIVRVTANVVENFSAPSMSTDGSRMVVTASRPLKEVWRVPFGSDPLQNGRNAVKVVDSSLDPMWIFVTRDGRTLLFNNALVGSRNLWTMPLDGSGQPRQITYMPGDAVMHASLSPDGAHVAFASSAAGPSDIWVQNTDGSDLRQLTNDSAADAWPVWSPDGRSIIFASLDDGGWVTKRVSADGGPAAKIVDGFFRGDWINKPDGSGTWIVTSVLEGGGGVRLLDGERRTVVWRDMQPGNALPMFSRDGRSVSIAYRETRDRDAIWVYDVATGRKRIAVQFPQQFHISFRASWVDDGRAFVVNRFETSSRIVLFDRFWKGEPSTSR